ncbi:MAG TPA: hypothetical protein VEX61_09425 [Burkholderiales bacterium]|nr:hypothetical protein [Burkholderiales bacterium]
MRFGGILAALCVVAVAPTAAAATPSYTPRSDSEVLERLAVPRLAGAATLRELREHWTAQPRSVPAALAYARAALELSRREEDPRYLGYAEAALAPWWDRPVAPPEIMLLRASMRLSRMDPANALRDLQSLIDSPAPEGHAARITRAAVRLSQGDPVASLADCTAASAYVSRLAAVTCTSAAKGLAGDAASGYAELDEALVGSAGAPLATELWARGVAAELAQRLGRPPDARRHFEDATRRMAAADATDPGLLASYADFLLDQREPKRVQTLLAPYPRQDTLLLRLTLAERALGLAGDTAAAAAAEERTRYLTLRFDEMRQRGDRTHLREQALFELSVRGNAANALQLLRQSWANQREPIDARLYLRAAVAAKQPEAAQPVIDWLRSAGLKDVRLQPELATVLKQAPSR